MTMTTDRPRAGIIPVVQTYRCRWCSVEIPEWVRLAAKHEQRSGAFLHLLHSRSHSEFYALEPRPRPPKGAYALRCPSCVGVGCPECEPDGPIWWHTYKNERLDAPIGRYKGPPEAREPLRSLLRERLQ